MLNLEELAPQNLNKQLTLFGWIIQDRLALMLPILDRAYQTGYGRTDYR